MEDEPDSDLLDVRDKPTYSWFAFGGTAANRLLGLGTLRCVRTGADCAGARRRGSGTPKQQLRSLVIISCNVIALTLPICHSGSQVQARKNMLRLSTRMSDLIFKH